MWAAGIFWPTVRDQRTDKGLLMRIGVALTLIAIGAILKFAIGVHNTHGFNVNTAGVILMIVGIIGLLAEVVFVSTRRRTDVVHERPPVATRTTYPEPPNDRY